MNKVIVVLCIFAGALSFGPIVGLFNSAAFCSAVEQAGAEVPTCAE